MTLCGTLTVPSGNARHDPNDTSSLRSGSTLVVSSASSVTDIESLRPQSSNESIMPLEKIDDKMLSEKNDPNIVDWNGLNDPQNPRNWSRPRKWVATVFVALFAFIPPLSSSMIAPELENVRQDLKISSKVQVELVLSIFLLAYSFGPFVLSPCSEIWGRKRIIQYGNAFFLIFNLVCSFAKNKSELIAFRFLAGLGGSATIGIGSGILSDCWDRTERGKGSSIYQLAPVLGPALGPIVISGVYSLVSIIWMQLVHKSPPLVTDMGGFIAEYSEWQWTFRSLSAFSLLIQLGGLFLLRESYPPYLLSKKARKLSKQTGNNKLRTKWESEDRTLLKLLKTSLSRPWILLGTQPIIQIIALYQAFNYGMLYLFISQFADMWMKQYHMKPSIASLNYISLAVGLLVGSQICGPLMDLCYKKLKALHGNQKPEYRIPLMIPAAIVEPISILIYGWAIHHRFHWIVPNLAVALFMGSSMIVYQGLQLYVTDAYRIYSASASAATMFLKSIFAFIFPLFAVWLCHVLGYGWSATVLAAAAVVLGIPAPILLWKFGEKLRARSLYAAGG